MRLSEFDNSRARVRNWVTRPRSARLVLVKTGAGNCVAPAIESTNSNPGSKTLPNPQRAAAESAKHNDGKSSRFPRGDVAVRRVCTVAAQTGNWAKQGFLEWYLSSQQVNSHSPPKDALAPKVQAGPITRSFRAWPARPGSVKRSCQTRPRAGGDEVLDAGAHAGCPGKHQLDRMSPGWRNS